MVSTLDSQARAQQFRRDQDRQGSRTDQQMRRSTFTDGAVTYGAVGGTQAADLLYYPPAGYRPLERTVRLGSGPERFETAVAALMTWGVQRRSGFEVTDVHEGTGEHYTGIAYDDQGTPLGLQERAEREAVFAEDGSPYISNGMTAVLKVPVGPFTLSAPVRVVYVVDEPTRIGYAYGSRAHHPVSGEEAFFVELHPDGAVTFTIRRFSRPATRMGRLFGPVVRWQQRRITTRYLRALLPARSA
jgi:uncharacterized protein (UPF0548 family)